MVEKTEKTEVLQERTKQDVKEKYKRNNGVPIGLRLEASLLKIKKMVDSVVAMYSGTTTMEPQEAIDIVYKKALNSMDRGLYGRAIDDFNRLISLGKEDAEIYYSLGICCERENLDEEAEKAYKKAVELDEKYNKAFYKLGLLAIKNDEPKSAIKYLSKLNGDSENSFDITYQLGVCHDKMKDYEKAIECFTKAIKIDPKYSKVYKRLGYAYDSTNKHEEAVDCFKKAMEMEEI